VAQLCAISSAVLGEIPSLVYNGVDLIAACVDKETASNSEDAKSLRLEAALTNIQTEIFILAGMLDPNTERERTTPDKLLAYRENIAYDEYIPDEKGI